MGGFLPTSLRVNALVFTSEGGLWGGFPPTSLKVFVGGGVGKKRCRSFAVLFLFCFRFVFVLFLYC